MLAVIGRVVCILLIGFSSLPAQSQPQHDKLLLVKDNLGDEFFVIYEYVLKTGVEEFDYLTAQRITPLDVYWHYREGERQSLTTIYSLPIHWRVCKEGKCPLHLLELQDGAWVVTERHFVNWKRVGERVFVLNFRERLRLRQDDLPVQLELSRTKLLEDMFGSNFNPIRPLNFEDVLVGRFDLNGDGVKELFVYIESSGFCGSMGCDGIIFQRQGENWREIGSFLWLFRRPNLGLADHGHLILLGVGKDGYRTLKSPTEIHRWDGTQYDWECLDNCGDKEE